VIDNSQDMQARFWRPLCTIWHQRYKAAQQAKVRFELIREQCMAFYHGRSGFMWDDDHKQKFFKGSLPDPKFKISLNKLFEFVELYGPSLFWQYPHRKVMSQYQNLLSPDILGDPNDPQVQQMFQMIMQQETRTSGRDDFANRLMEAYLNYSQRECDLTREAVLSIKEALVSGMGILWPETYQYPNSDDVFTRLRWGSVANVFVDADCHDPQWETAGYIFRRHITPSWQVERIFDLPVGSLRQYATRQTAEQAVREEALTDERSGGPKQDMTEWVEAWSRVGIGPKVVNAEQDLLDQFDDVVGDFAYVCFIPDCPFMLNAPPGKFFGSTPWNNEEVKKAFEWRAPNYGHAFPAHDDNRWPIKPLVFNELMGSAWPIAPGAPALGYLITLNILTSSYVDQAWQNRRTIIAYLESEAEMIAEKLKSDEPFVTVGINGNLYQDIKQIIQQLPPIQTNKDILVAIQMMEDGFNRAIGLNELMYGNSGATQIRVAADIRERSARSSIRPEKMASDVAAWMTDCSQLEMFLAALHVNGDSLMPLIGEFGSKFWNEYFGKIDPAKLMREMVATVEASEVRRPNKETDTANIQSLQQYWLPLCAQYAQQTGNTDPLNALLDRIGEATEMDTSGFMLPPWQPPEDPEQKQLAQAAAMAEVEKNAATAEKQRASAQKDIASAIETMTTSGISDGFAAEGEHVQELRHREELHNQELRHNEDEAVLKIESALMQQEATQETGDEE
jgi:hypothetical protein